MSARVAARLRLRPGDLGEPVLERILGALAARVDLPVDRLAVAQMASGALVPAAARHAPDGVVRVELGAGSGRIDLALGPLPAGTGAQVVAETALPGVGVVLDRLVDSWSIDALDSGDEMLRMRIGSGTPTPP